MSIMLMLSAILAGLVLVAVGLFSLAALLWGDLLEVMPSPKTAHRPFRTRS